MYNLLNINIMCVIITKDSNVKKPTKSVLYQAYRANSNGCGFAVLKANGSLFSYKSLNFNKFYENFEKHVTDSDRAIIHFRLATHGSPCTANCHPFTNADKSLYFAHNGVLPIESKNNQTDSQILFDSVLAPAVELYGLRSQTFDEIVGAVIGGSKFAFIDKQGIKTFGTFTRLNGLLFSNLRGIYLNENGAYGCYSTSYRTDDFYFNLFEEHNKPYKTKKFSWQF